MDKIIICFIVILLLNGCKQRNSSSDKVTDSLDSNYDVEKIVNFSDQKRLSIGQEHFTIKMDEFSQEYYHFESRPYFRYDNYAGRFWARYYNGFYEVRVHDWEGELYSCPDYHYIIGMKENPRGVVYAFYIKWLNYSKFDHINPNSDIGENTIYLETNLPDSLIKSYYVVPCEIKHNITIKDSLLINWEALRIFKTRGKIVEDEEYWLRNVERKKKRHDWRYIR